MKISNVIAHFEISYEIPRFDELDFMFDLQGVLNRKEFLEKTIKLRSYPRHMKYSLFCNTDDKLNELRKKEFPIVFFVYDEVKEKGNKLYKKKKYREAVRHYIYAYNCLKWLEFKDKKRNKDVVASASLDPILDDDIEEMQLKVDENAVEKDSYIASIVFLLLNLSYAYMELRHYREAINCLDECQLLAGDKLSDIYFRRSQARTFNKTSSQDDYDLAGSDIDKAISLAKDVKIYQEHREKLNEIRCLTRKKEMANLKGLLVIFYFILDLLEKAQYSYKVIKEKNLSNDQVFFFNSKEKETHYKILKEYLLLLIF
jgi:hypothetical protein